MLTKIVELRPESAIEVATTEYGVHEDAKASGIDTAGTASKLTDTAADFVAAGVEVNDIVKNTTDGTFALVTAVDSATVLSLGTDIMSDEDEYEIYSGRGFKLQDLYNEIVATLDVTAAADAAGDTLDVYLDTSFDGGSKWVNLVHFTQVVGNGGAKRFVAALKAAPVATSNVVDGTADQSAANALQIGFGDRLRYRATTVNDTAVEFTYSLKVFLKK